MGEVEDSLGRPRRDWRLVGRNQARLFAMRSICFAFGSIPLVALSGAASTTRATTSVDTRLGPSNPHVGCDRLDQAAIGAPAFAGCRKARLASRATWTGSTPLVRCSGLTRSTRAMAWTEARPAGLALLPDTADGLRPQVYPSRQLYLGQASRTPTRAQGWQQNADHQGEDKPVV
jgi:hypothetical protein